MKKRIAVGTLAVLLVLLGSFLLGRERSVLGIRIYADDALIYEGSGAALEDIRLTLDPETAGVGHLRVEYTAQWDGEIFPFPSIYIDLPAAQE